MWFGWRANRIFPEAGQLAVYCRNPGVNLNLFAMGIHQKIRYWFSGICSDQTVFLEMTDSLKEVEPWEDTLSVQIEDHLVGFRKIFINGVSRQGLLFDAFQQRAALWPERISWEGLDALGRVLESFYLLSFQQEASVLDIEPFARVAAICPSSFLICDLLGWAHYRRNEYGLARDAFMEALKQNPSGIGAVSGLIKCAKQTQNPEATRYWMRRKAEIRQELYSDP